LPESPGHLSALDWRILAFYRDFPEASHSKASSSLGITLKTLSLRRDRLIDGHAMWWCLTVQSARFPFASFYVALNDESRLFNVKSTLEAAVPGWIPCAEGGFGLEPTVETRQVSGLSTAVSLASADEVARVISGIPGVASVRWRIPRDFRSYPEWFDTQILSRLAGERGLLHRSSGIRSGALSDHSAGVRPILSRFSVEGLVVTPPTGLITPASPASAVPANGFSGRRPRRFQP